MLLMKKFNPSRIFGTYGAGRVNNPRGKGSRFREQKQGLESRRIKAR